MARTLNTITKAINKKVSAEAKTSFELGTLLAEARDGHFTNDKGKVNGKDFVAWGGDNFGFKKAQMYTYIKVATVFGTDALQEAFADVPISVLHAMTRDGEMLNAAAEAIEDGDTVDVKWMKNYQKELEKLRKQENGGSDEGEDGEDEDNGEGGEGGKGRNMADAYVDELEAKVEKLEGELEEAKKDSHDFTDHFVAVADRMRGMSPEMALGLPEGTTDKRKVNKAKRELLAIYGEPMATGKASVVVEVIEAAAVALIGETGKKDKKDDKKDGKKDKKK